MAEQKNTRKVLIGTVTSDKADKTVTVMVVRRYRHALYKKMVTSKKTYMAHDEENSCKTGDTVKIRECAPVSKRKKWLVVERMQASGR